MGLRIHTRLWLQGAGERFTILLQERKRWYDPMCDEEAAEHARDIDALYGEMERVSRMMRACEVRLRRHAKLPDGAIKCVTLGCMSEAVGYLRIHCAYHRERAFIANEARQQQARLDEEREREWQAAGIAIGWLDPVTMKPIVSVPPTAAAQKKRA